MGTLLLDTSQTKPALASIVGVCASSRETQSAIGASEARAASRGLRPIGAALAILVALAVPCAQAQTLASTGKPETIEASRTSGGRARRGRQPHRR